MSLQKKLTTKSIVAILATCFALAVPTAASAHFFFWWWRRPPAAPVQDVTFLDATTVSSRIFDVYFLNDQFDDFESFHLVDQALTAQVTTGSITIGSFSLTDGNGTTANCSSSTANLTTDVFGSSFRADVTIDVVPLTGSSYSIAGHIHGRISEKNGVYTLRASIGGISPEDLGAGSVVYHLVRIYLTGTGAVPAAP